MFHLAFFPPRLGLLHSISCLIIKVRRRVETAFHSSLVLAFLVCFFRPACCAFWRWSEAKTSLLDKLGSGNILMSGVFNSLTLALLSTFWKYQWRHWVGWHCCSVHDTTFLLSQLERCLELDCHFRYEIDIRFLILTPPSLGQVRFLQNLQNEIILQNLQNEYYKI